MDVLTVIKNRRSVRAFNGHALSAELLQELLLMGTKAPSGKNRQPWSFVVLQEKAKERLVSLMEKTAGEKEAKGQNIGSLRISLQAIHEAGAIVLVYNPYARLEPDYSANRRLMDTQSIGAAIENIILAAEAHSLGTLWICDVFQCEPAISDCFGQAHELVAAVAIGYPAQHPYERRRKSLEQVTTWLCD